MLQKTTSTPIEIKFSQTDSDGTFTGVASVFGGEPDSQGDVISKGAYAASLAEHKAAGTSPLLLWQHDIHNPIGVWESIQEDAAGLIVKGRLILDTKQGAEAYALIKGGALSGLSIGYTVTGYEELPSGGRLLTGINLAEISLVSLPSAKGARVTSVKSAEEITPRFIERTLRDAGCSKAMAAGIVSAGFRGAMDTRRDAEAEAVNTIIDKLNAATAALQRT